MSEVEKNETVTEDQEPKGFFGIVKALFSSPKGDGFWGGVEELLDGKPGEAPSENSKPFSERKFVSAHTEDESDDMTSLSPESTALVGNIHYHD